MPALPGALPASRGFSLLELLISMVVLTIVMGALMQFMGMLQQRYTREQRAAGASQTGKTVLELLAMDTGQAGYLGGGETTTTANITADPAAQPAILVNLNNIFNNIYVNRVLIVDLNQPGALLLQENVRVQSVDAGAGTVTALFKLSHAPGTYVRISDAPYPQGILYSTATDATNVAYTSNSTRLRILGELWGDGNLRFVEYIHTFGADCTGRITRSDSPALVNTVNAPVVVAENVCNDPSGTPPISPVFSYPGAGPMGTFTYVPEVVVNVIVQTQRSSVEEVGSGGPRRIAMRQSFAPRNVLWARRMAQDGLADLLPTPPPTLPGPITVP
ncbi:MAG: PilW family protein [Longimicrobiales bacterium]